MTHLPETPKNSSIQATEAAERSVWTSRASMAFLFVAAAGLGGCATFLSQNSAKSRGQAIAAINNKDYLGAATYFSKSRCAGQDAASEDSDNCDIVRQAERTDVNYFIARARDLTRNRGDAEYFNKYRWAIDYYKKALAIDPDDETAKNELRNIESLLAKSEKDYVEARSGLENRLSADIDDASWKDIQTKFEGLRRLIIKLEKIDKSPVSLAVKYARKLDGKGDIKKAFEATQYAEKLMEAMLELQEKGQAHQPLLETEDEQFIAMVSKAFAEGVNTGQISLRTPRKVSRPTVSKKTDTRSVPPPDIQPNPEALRAVESVLAKVRADYNLGRIYEALVGIDKAIKGLSANPQVGQLEDQRSQWASDRDALVLEYKTKADALYVAEKDEESDLNAYQKVLMLMLSPSDDTRSYIEGRIATLKAVIKAKEEKAKEEEKKKSTKK
jgi:tetratricopeptide (TPR) repeat protein